MLEANTLQLEAEGVTVRTRHLIKYRKLYTHAAPSVVKLRRLIEVPPNFPCRSPQAWRS